MIVIKGQGVCGGIAFGKLELLRKKTNKIIRAKVSDTDSEMNRFEDARQKALDEVRELYKKALTEVGEQNAMIFEIHEMMLEDVDFLDYVKTNIKNQKLNAESAVAIAADNFSEMFLGMDDTLMQGRAADVKDISERIISILLNSKSVQITSNEPVIIGAEDLVPSETVQLDKTKILAFVTEKGSASSHTSILARTMNIPAVVGAEGLMDKVNNGVDIIVDGFSGKIYIDPDMNTVLLMQEKRQQIEEQNELLLKLKGVKPITKDGQEILLYANIGSVSDMSQVYANDAMGVGLFRSEFLFLERNSYPSEDEQFSAYKEAAQKAFGKRIIIRTLDIGADKKVEYFEMPEEENPAMGVRAIRICLTRPEIFKTQLRALYRASIFGKIAIMFPMITSLDEIRQIKEICEEVKSELKHEEIPFDENMETGIMIETPAAVLISDKLAQEVDFFSIGTNDLTQYTLAIDRQNLQAERFCDVHHVAILRMIKIVVDNAHKYGKWTGICGELASDMELTELFLAMGVDELSVPPAMILPLKQKIINTDVSDIKDASLAILH